VVYSSLSSTDAIATVRKPENDVLKYGSIALGVVVGSLFSYRRGIIRKLAYPTIGGLGEQASEKIFPLAIV
jgi:hypothetical protein